jgi:hypothetical protein
MSRDNIWGADVPVSLPEPLESTEATKIPMDGFCFTADGLRVDITEAEREQLVASGYGPGAVR